jgi:hypothetical protein
MTRSLFTWLWFLVLGFALSAVLALPIMWLWNGVVPAIFGLKLITFRQALGLSLLCNLLFKSPSAKCC